MKKIFFTAIVLTALLMATVGTAFAGSALELEEVRNDDGVPTFVFRVTGEFSNEELESGFVIVGDEVFPLYCAQTAPEIVVCHTSKAAAGHRVVVGFGGARFWDKVPEQAPPGFPNLFCYPIYGSNNANEPTNYAQIGIRCDETDDVYEFNYVDPYFGLSPFVWLFASEVPGWLAAPPVCSKSYTSQGQGFYGPCVTPSSN